MDLFISVDTGLSRHSHSSDSTVLNYPPENEAVTGVCAIRGTGGRNLASGKTSKE